MIIIMAPSLLKVTKLTKITETVITPTSIITKIRIMSKFFLTNNNRSLLIFIYRKFYFVWLMMMIMIMKLSASIIFFILCVINLRKSSAASLIPYSNLEYDTVVQWTHVIDLNEDFRVHWTINNNHQDITFELHVRTLGYIGFGFSLDGSTNGADLAVGWVDDGHTFFQDRYMDREGSMQPHVDPSQDYILIKGYENSTHTLLRFRRKLDTCDYDYDLIINNDTMRIIYMYHDEDPLRGVSTLSPLPSLKDAWRPYKPLILLQKPFNNPMESMIMSSSIQSSDRTLELRNHEVELPYGDDSLLWCKLFKLDELPKKHSIIQYSPLFDSSWSYHYLQQITLYECPSNNAHVIADLEYNLRSAGQICSMGARSLPMGCNAIVASWTRGSYGFTFPPEAGYPLEAKHVKYFMMETHYNNLHATFEPYQLHRVTDNSGLKITFTSNVRLYDAGVLSIGMDPNWRHIIPPGQERVLSQGQCMEDCTGSTFPPAGINIFAVMMRTHQIGRQITLRQIRQNEELYPIAYDHNIDSTYQEFRRLNHLVRSLPGDRLITECIYDSSSRRAITLGGHTMKEEACIALTYYYPRQKQLTTCHSLPSLPTVLHSLGIEQLAMNSNPVVISSPSELAGMTLEARLLSYDWKNQFGKFQQATLNGTFKPICSGAHNQLVPLTEHFIGHQKNITKRYKEIKRCKPKRLSVTEMMPQLELPVLHDIVNNHIGDTAAASASASVAAASASTSVAAASATSNNIINGEGSVRSSRSSFIETLALSGSESLLLLNKQNQSYRKYYNHLTSLFGFNFINVIPFVWWWWWWCWLLSLWIVS